LVIHVTQITQCVTAHNYQLNILQTASSIQSNYSLISTHTTTSDVYYIQALPAVWHQHKNTYDSDIIRD